MSASVENITIKGKAGQPIDLPISAGPPTGYTWSLKLPAGVTQIDDAPGRHVDADRRLGTGVSGSMRVLAPQGYHRIEARLIRPWAPDKPARILNIDLSVD